MSAQSIFLHVLEPKLNTFLCALPLNRNFSFENLNDEEKEVDRNGPLKKRRRMLSVRDLQPLKHMNLQPQLMPAPLLAQRHHDYLH